MAITGESLFNSYKNLTSADTNGTYYEVVNGGSTQGKVVSFLNIVNGDTITHTVTLSFDRYSGGSYGVVFERAYTILAGENKVAVDFMIPLLAGANPDRIQAKTTAAVSSNKKVTVMASGPDFS